VPANDVASRETSGDASCPDLSRLQLILTYKENDKSKDTNKNTDTDTEIQTRYLYVPSNNVASRENSGDASCLDLSRLRDAHCRKRIAQERSHT
jgi:hypothetical protein